MQYKKWSEEEIEKLKEIYSYTPIDMVCSVFNRSGASIKHKAERLSLKKEMLYWTAEELNYLNLYYSTQKNSEISKILHRTERAIRIKASKLGMHKIYDSPQESECEICGTTTFNERFCCNECRYIGQSEEMSGENHPLFGKSRSIATRNKISVTQIARGTAKGENNPMFGKHHTDATKQIIAIKNTGNFHTDKWKKERSIIGKKLWQNKEYREKVVRSILSSLCKTPNKLEQRLIKIAEEYSLQYKFVGDGSFLLHGLNPDFVNTNGKKIAIEIFGDYWHNNKNTKWHQTEFGRKAVFSQLGFKTLVIWEHELNSLTDEGIVERIKTFEVENE